MAERTHRAAGADLEVDGLLNLEDFEEETGFELPEGPYETVAGFVVAELGALPEVGTTVEVAGHRLTVTELDGRRASRIRVSRVEVTGSPDPEVPMGESPA